MALRGELELAIRSLDQLQSYSSIDRTTTDWNLSLRGPV